MALKVGGKGYIADINVTPFVDVMLVLLIIFMVTAPLMTQGLEVDLPQTKTVAVLPQGDDHMILTIKKDGTVHLDEYVIKDGELAANLEKFVKAQNKALFLNADAAVPYGRVVAVMGEIKSAGIDKMGVIAEPFED
jgi:biopolymer transport protein TolR